MIELQDERVGVTAICARMDCQIGQDSAPVLLATLVAPYRRFCQVVGPIPQVMLALVTAIACLAHWLEATNNYSEQLFVGRAARVVGRLVS